MSNQLDEKKTTTELLQKIKAQKEVHEKFKATYNKQMAFDFNLLDFINPGENKLSEILAYFLKEDNPHGQGAAFLKEFIDYFLPDIGLTTANANVKTEYRTKENRRIDLWIELKDNDGDDGFVVAIENKIWAIDQDQQLQDYSNYLENRFNGRFILYYLSPYRKKPSNNSIDEESYEKLNESEKVNLISYKTDIITLIDRWIFVCEADKVNVFLKQLKEYLETKFVGTKTLSMTDQIQSLIKEYQEETNILINAYYEIDKKINNFIKKAGNKLDNEILNYKQDGIDIKSQKKKDIFFKYHISLGGDTITIRLGKHNDEKLKLFLEYQLLNGQKESLKRKIEEEEKLIQKSFDVDDLQENKISEKFKNQTHEAIQILKDFHEKVI